MNDLAIRQFINSFIDDPKTVVPTVLDEVTLTNIETIIDEYDNKEKLFEELAIYPYLQTILLQELTPEKIKKYRYLRLEHYADVLSCKEEIKQRLIHCDQQDISFMALVDMFREDFNTDNSAMVEALLEVFLSVMTDMAQADKLVKEDVLEIKKVFHNVSYSLDYMIDKKRFQFDLEGLLLIFELQDRFEMIEGIVKNSYDLYSKIVTQESPNIVYLDESIFNEERLPILYHEGEHFIDSLILKNKLHSTVREVVDSLRNKITEEDIRRFIDDYQRELNGYTNYLLEYEKDIKDLLNEDLKNEYLNYNQLSSEEKQSMINERYNKYSYDFANNKMFDNGYNAVFDILDGLSKGTLQKKFPTYEVGHGVLFNKDEDSIYKEVLAEISLLYNIGCPDLLAQYFPYEEVKELISVYEQSINVDFLQFRIVSYKNTRDSVNSILYYLQNHDVSSLSPNIRSEIENMNPFMIQAAIVSYKVAANYLEEAMWDIDEKYGNGSFMNLLIQYDMDDDVSIFPDPMLRTYISMLDDGHVHMFVYGNMAEEEEMVKI